MYSVEIKKTIQKRLEIEPVNKISKETGISMPTLYNWKKEKKEANGLKITNESEIQEEQDNKQRARKEKDEPIQSQRIAEYIKQGKLEEAKEIALKYPKYEPIQSQLIALYIKQEKLEEAKEMALKYPNNEIIQSQLITIYIKQEKLEEAKEIALKYPNNEIIQGQIKNPYVKQRKIEKAKEIELKYPIDKQKTQDEEMKNNFVKKNEAKIYLNILSSEDIKEVQSKKEQMNQREYYITLLAMYARMKMKKNIERCWKEYTKSCDVESSDRKKILELMKNKGAFDLQKWGNLIGYNMANLDPKILEQVKTNQSIFRKSIQESVNKGSESKEPVCGTTQAKGITKKNKRKWVTSEQIIAKEPTSETSHRQKSVKKEKEVDKKERLKAILPTEMREAIRKIQAENYAKMQLISNSDREVADTAKKHMELYDNIEELLSAGAENIGAFKKIQYICKRMNQSKDKNKVADKTR